MNCHKCQTKCTNTGDSWFCSTCRIHICHKCKEEYSSTHNCIEDTIQKLKNSDSFKEYVKSVVKEVFDD